MNIKSARLILFTLLLATAVLVAQYHARARLSQLISVKNNVVQTGRLSITTNPSEGWFSLNNLLPGEEYDRTVTITNTGSVGTRLLLSARKAAGYSAVFNALKLRIVIKETEIFNDTLDKLTNIELLPHLPVNGSVEAGLRLYLPLAAGSEVENSYTNITFDLLAEQT